MGEKEAVEIARQFLITSGIAFGPLERAFFVPVSTYESAMPEMNDEWIVHFEKVGALDPEVIESVVSCGNSIIVAIDATTGNASIFSTL